jgi:hypothetical protein
MRVKLTNLLRTTSREAKQAEGCLVCVSAPLVRQPGINAWEEIFYNRYKIGNDINGKPRRQRALREATR